MNDLALDKKEYQEYKRKRVAKPLLWFGMVSIIMLFAGLTSAVLVRRGDGNWMQYDIPEVFLWSTICIFISSVALIIASVSARKDNKGMVKLGVGATLLLGLVFIALQFEGYQQLVERGVYMTGAEHNASGSFLYIISGVHLAHLLGGIIALIVVFFNAMKGKYSSKNLLGLQVCSTYWHFLGALWIYLYLFFRTVI
jgi:cytochrome c oxidase subunit 3